MQLCFFVQEQRKVHASNAATLEAAQRAAIEAGHQQAEIQRLERELHASLSNASRLEQQLMDSAMQLQSVSETCTQLQLAAETHFAEHRRLETVRLARGRFGGRPFAVCNRICAGTGRRCVTLSSSWKKVPP
jgi:hypothetical protein